LRCAWCHNVENINPYQEFFHNIEKCVKCGACAEVCPEEAITPPTVQRRVVEQPSGDASCCGGGPTPKSLLTGGQPTAIEEEESPGEIEEIRPPKIDRDQCTRCMQCVDACKFGALTKVSTLMTLEEVFDEVKSDEMFYQSSGGGMTLSGGEPLAHPEVALALLKRARDNKIHTALDTSAFAKWETLESLLEFVDLVLLDIKTLDDEKHLKWTGVSNALILENARKMAEKGVIMRLRLPIIHDVNFWDLEFPRSVVKFAKELGDSVSGIDILPYHGFAESKCDQLGKDNFFKGFPSLFKEDVEDYEKIIKEGGTWDVTVGGMIGIANSK
jgi:pyruvate formate lyase activating enzyme